jgi:hypothetical protein
VDAPGPAKLSAGPSSKGVSVGEFVRLAGLRKHTDLVLAFGHYLEQQANATEFSVADINNCYYEAKIEPSNISQSLVQNIRRGFVMEARSDGNSAKKRYRLTATGERRIQDLVEKGRSASK